MRRIRAGLILIFWPAVALGEDIQLNSGGYPAFVAPIPAGFELGNCYPATGRPGNTYQVLHKTSGSQCALLMFSFQPDLTLFPPSHRDSPFCFGSMDYAGEVQESRKYGYPAYAFTCLNKANGRWSATYVLQLDKSKNFPSAAYAVSLSFSKLSSGSFQEGLVNPSEVQPELLKSAAAAFAQIQKALILTPAPRGNADMEGQTPDVLR